MTILIKFSLSSEGIVTSFFATLCSSSYAIFETFYIEKLKESQSNCISCSDLLKIALRLDIIIPFFGNSIRIFTEEFDLRGLSPSFKKTLNYRKFNIRYFSSLIIHWLRNEKYSAWFGLLSTTLISTLSTTYSFEGIGLRLLKFHAKNGNPPIPEAALPCWRSITVIISTIMLIVIPDHSQSLH